MVASAETDGAVFSTFVHVILVLTFCCLFIINGAELDRRLDYTGADIGVVGSGHCFGLVEIVYCHFTVVS